MFIVEKITVTLFVLFIFGGCICRGPRTVLNPFFPSTVDSKDLTRITSLAQQGNHQLSISSPAEHLTQEKELNILGHHFRCSCQAPPSILTSLQKRELSEPFDQKKPENLPSHLPRDCPSPSWFNVGSPILDKKKASPPGFS